MARRQRLPSWVDDEPKKTPAPKPLRYRIDPTAEQADKLDAMLAELESQASGMDYDDYTDLKDILEGRQKALAARVRRLKGQPLADVVHQKIRVPWRTRVRWTIPLGPVGFKVCMGLVVLIWLIAKNSG